MLQDFEFLKSKQEETLKKLADTQASHFDLKCSFVTSQYVSLSCQCPHVPVICHA